MAGVYDARARTLDVYLNGKLDDGSLRGTISHRQRSSRTPVCVGRRSNLAGFEFAGTIDDVRIYSFALTGTEVAAVMRGTSVVRPVSSPGEINGGKGEHLCRASDREDSSLPAFAGALGVLAVFTCLGFRPTMPALVCLAVGLAAGTLVLAGAPSELPSFNEWLIPLTSLAGGASVMVSRRVPDPERLARPRCQRFP